jgi:hypothetical protein
MNNLHSKSAVSSEQLAVSSRQSAGKTNSFLPTAICQLLTISIFLLTANCLLLTSANAIGTTANTQILNTPTAVTLNFSNATGTGTVTRNSDNSVTSSVTAVYGVSAVITDVSKTTEAGVETTAFAHTITNASNTTVNLNANSGEFTLLGSSPGDFADWKNRFGSSVGILDGWVTLNGTPLPQNLESHSTSIYNGRIYVLGGTDASVVTDSVYFADINVNGTLSNWVQTTSLPKTLRGHTSSVHNGRIYVVGGYDSVNATNSVYVSVINTNGTLGSWVQTTSVPLRLYGHATVVYKNHIYVSGGLGTGGFQKKVYVATINADGSLSAWDTHSNDGQELTQATYGHAASVYNGRMYILGGLTASGEVDTVYVTTMNADGTLTGWTSTTPLLQIRQGHTASIHQGTIYITGGYNFQAPGYRNIVYKATINADGLLSSWTTLSTTPLPQPLLHHTAIVYDGRLFILGGTNLNSVQNTVYVTNFLDTQYTNIAGDGAQGFDFYTTPSSYAFNNSQGLVTLNYFLSSDIPSSRIGNYTGFNNTSYGGTARISSLTTTTIQAPDVVLLSRTVTAIAPTGVGYNYDGSTTDTVPGSQLSYTIVVKNVGSSASNTVNVVEKINNLNDVAYYYSNATTANFTMSFVPINSIVNYSVESTPTTFDKDNSYLTGKYKTDIAAIRWTLDSIPPTALPP